MIRGFRGQGTQDVFDGSDTKAARKVCPANLLAVARRKLDQLNRVESLAELRIPPNNRLELLHSDRQGQYSIRINDQYRVCFTWEMDGPHGVEIVDYHS